MARKLRAAALYGGIGSMLIAAKQEGFEIVGNVEPRKKYFPEATFKHNFGLPLLREMTPELLAEWNKSVDLLLMHPSCGKFSSLSYAHPNKVQEDNFPALLPQLKQLRNVPVIIIDNLPGAMIHFTAICAALPGHGVFPEMIEAWHLGVPQRRRRLFFICTRTGHTPRSDETELRTSALELLARPLLKLPNHHPHSRSHLSGQNHPLLDTTTGKWILCKTYGDLADLLMRRLHKSGKRGLVDYRRKSDGVEHHRPGIRLIGDRITVTGSTYLGHPTTGLPLSIRERARLQGFPDNFVFLPERLESDGTWVFRRNMTLIKQTGKAVPIPVTRSFVKQAKAWLLGREPKVTGLRFTKSDPEVDAAKMKYCKARGYSNQRAACEACAIHDTCEVRDAVLSKRR